MCLEGSWLWLIVWDVRSLLFSSPLLRIDLVFSGTTPKAAADAPPPVITAPVPTSPAVLAPHLAGLNEHLAKFHASLPPRTALFIFTGHSDPRKMSALNARKAVFETALKNREYAEKARAAKGETAAAGEDEAIAKDIWWTSSDARELEEQVEFAKRGLLFAAITK